MYYGNRKQGRAFFNGDVTYPLLLQDDGWVDGPTVWMSYTVNEVLTQRQGVRLAKGRVVVGGLGLGWFLNAVCQKASVTEVILVEREAALLSWLMPRILAVYPAISQKSVTIVNDCVWNFMEKDVPHNGEKTKYLLDIWDSYNTSDPKLDLYQNKLGRSRVWGWGCFS